VVKTARYLVNPNDPVAVINGELITRQQLADECFVRKGIEILETMIARKLVDQEIKKRHLDVTPAEVDAEIERVAHEVAGVTREQWLAALAKDKNISPAQYARDIIYPSIALRKLAAPRVKVTPADIQEAMESRYGTKLRCRIIMVESQQKAIAIWNDLNTKKISWETAVATYSFDQATKAVGGMLSEPIARHAEPRNVTDAVFRDLVDGDPTRAAKPKDGDVSSVIELAKETGTPAWVIFKREGVVAAQTYDKNDPKGRKLFESAIYEAKVQAEIGEVFNQLARAAAIENKLTGSLKLANEEEKSQSLVDGNVKLMSDPNGAIPDQKAKATGPAGKATVAPPSGVSAQDLKDAEKLKRE
jgi:foldase protein PrsA